MVIRNFLGVLLATLASVLVLSGPAAATPAKETPKTKTKEYIEWGLKLLFTATGITVAFFALMFLGFESVETKEQQEVQMWCDEYMPELSIRACMDEAGL